MPIPNPVAQKIRLSQIQPDPTLDRSHFDPEKLAELAASMKAHGLMNPISVRLVKGEGGGEKGVKPGVRPAPRRRTLPCSIETSATRCELL